MNFHFSQNELADFKENAKREWALTNGIGGYAGGCVLGGALHQRRLRPRRAQDLPRLRRKALGQWQTL